MKRCMGWAVLAALWLGCGGSRETPNDEVTTTMTSGDEEALDEAAEPQPRLGAEPHTPNSGSSE